VSECPDEANRDWRSISSLFASGLSDGATPPFHASGDRPAGAVPAVRERADKYRMALGLRDGPTTLHDRCSRNPFGARGGTSGSWPRYF